MWQVVSNVLPMSESAAFGTQWELIASIGISPPKKKHNNHACHPISTQQWYLTWKLQTNSAHSPMPRPLTSSPPEAASKWAGRWSQRESAHADIHWINWQVVTSEEAEEALTAANMQSHCFLWLFCENIRCLTSRHWFSLLHNKKLPCIPVIPLSSAVTGRYLNSNTLGRQELQSVSDTKQLPSCCCTGRRLVNPS